MRPGPFTLLAGAVVVAGLLACTTVQETALIASSTGPFSSTYVQTSHKDYGFYLEWAAAPLIEFRIDATTAEALSSYALEIDGQVLAKANNVPGDSAGGQFTLPADPKLGRLLIRNGQGVETRWRYDFKRGFLTLDPYPSPANQLQREN